MAIAGLTALFHDLLITFGIYGLVGFEVTPATVVAILTILGYSLYDTVVVFDKVNENVEEMHDRYTYTEIVNASMNQVLMRSINTSLTSLLPVGSLLFVGSFAFGAETLREFALALAARFHHLGGQSKSCRVLRGAVPAVHRRGAAAAAAGRRTRSDVSRHRRSVPRRPD